MTEPLRLTNSEIKSFRRCRRQWMLGYYRRLTKLDEPLAGRASTLGTRVHDALAVIYTPEGGDPLQVVRESIERDIAIDASQASEIEKEGELARLMIEGYLDWLEETGADSDFRLLASESRVEVEMIPDKVRLLSKLDARVQRLSDGTRFALEHKTVGDFTRPVPTLQIDSQLLTEHLGEFLELREKGREGTRAEGVLYNMLRRVKRTAQAKPPFYKRHEVMHNLDELRNHWKHVLAYARDIHATTRQLDAGADHHKVAPPSPMQSCSWDCPFLAPCSMMNRNERADDYLKANYKEHDPLERYLGTVQLDD